MPIPLTTAYIIRVRVRVRVRSKADKNSLGSGFGTRFGLRLRDDRARVVLKMGLGLQYSFRSECSIGSRAHVVAPSLGVRVRVRVRGMGRVKQSTLSLLKLSHIYFGARAPRYGNLKIFDATAKEGPKAAYCLLAYSA